MYYIYIYIYNTCIRCITNRNSQNSYMRSKERKKEDLKYGVKLYKDL